MNFFYFLHSADVYCENFVSLSPRLLLRRLTNSPQVKLRFSNCINLRLRDDDPIIRGRLACKITIGNSQTCPDYSVYALCKVLPVSYKVREIDAHARRRRRASAGFDGPEGV